MAYALPILRPHKTAEKALGTAVQSRRTNDRRIRHADAAARQNIDGRKLEMVESRHETEQRGSVPSTAATRPTMFCAPLSECEQDGRRK
jgi:hypothetical protein